MKLLVLLSFVSGFFTNALVYYISPGSVANRTCIVNGSTPLTPCYSLQRLCEERALLTNKTQLKLLLLPGTHVIPQGHNLSASDMWVLDALPWNEQQEVVIECEKQARLVFEGIGELAMSTLKFSSCNMRCICSQRNSTIKVRITVVNCIFTGSMQKYALHIISASLSTNVSVSESKFSLNNGGIICEASRAAFFSLFISDTVFEGNWRGGEGGALYMTNIELELRRCQFISNEATSGGAIYSKHSHSFFYPSSSFIADTLFKRNIATAASGTGGAICILALITTNVFLSENTFLENAANGSGGACYFNVYGSVQLSHCHFKNNMAVYGGAVYSSSASVDFGALELNNCTFMGNAADALGGALYLARHRSAVYNCLFTKNVAGSGGGIYSIVSAITIKDDIFQGNTAKMKGGAWYLESESAGGKFYRFKFSVIMARTTFEYNRAGDGGAMYCSCETNPGCKISVWHKLDIQFNEAANGGGIYAVNSTLLLDAFITMTNNTAESRGGALFLDKSVIMNTAVSHVTLQRNTITASSGKGGGIFVLDESCSISPCFLQLGTSNLTLDFDGDVAAYGSVLYGGLLNRCLVSSSEQHLLGIDYFKQHSQYQPTPLAISSDPVRVCLCMNTTLPDCSTRELTNVTKMRGEVVNLILVSLDQDNNPLLSTIRAYYSEPLADIDVGEGRRTVHSGCTSLSYHVFTSEQSVTLVLQPVGICERSAYSAITVQINLLPCSRGFQLSKDRCVCEIRITDYFGNAAVCNIDTQSIERRGSIWLRYDEQHLQLHNTCPLDYCDISSDTISLSSPDEQCADHRSGVLCGECQYNHSIALGGNKCLHCASNYAFIWLSLVFATAGVALVALLLVCNMTISTGTLNGLIFYANVISLSGLTNLQNCSIHPILAVFIAWLNLDLGVETCFYPGMDTYQKTWLQFAFPLYIWLLVVTIIVASYYSSTAMKVFGRNNIAILATLFLLSYSKILKTIVTALSVTQVLAGSAGNTSDQLVPYKVWTHDGNVEYLKGKHVPLFIVSLLFLLLLFLPYTLLLTFGQCLRSMSARRRPVLWCVRSTAFISIMDAYHAPYQGRHRYWTGFLLLTRCVLFLSFAASYGDDDVLLNVYITNIIISGVLVAKMFIFTKTYRVIYLNVLELCFLVNLEALTATLSYLKGSNSSYNERCVTTSVSISISLLVFVGVLVYHTHLRMRRKQWYTSIKLTLFSMFKCFRAVSVREDNTSITTEHHGKKLPTTTLVELREELL
jgi:predicted outer membrane repeat protein